MKYHRRPLRLVRPGLQLRMILVFVATSALALLVQYLLFASALSECALELPHDGLVLMDEVNGVLQKILIGSFAVFLPITFVLGILTTQRFAGPIYRLERFLREIIAGARPGDCRLRKGDELQDFCELLNHATGPLRRAPSALKSESPPPPLPAPKAETHSAADVERGAR